MVKDLSEQHYQQKRQNKATEYDGYKGQLKCATYGLTMIPLYICLILPLALICYPMKYILPKQKKQLQISSTTTQNFQRPKEIPPLNDRPYSVIIYGATGFTGRLAAKYYGEKYSTGNRRWAIAGRNKKGLQNIKDEIIKKYPKVQDYVDILIADSTKPETLEKIIPLTRVIACTAGPFDLYATPIVQLCSLYGTHYVDITGETDWVRKMVDTYDDDAKNSGAKIVHFCGHDCVPWDMAVYLLAEELRKRNENLIKVDCFDEINGAYSGGTMATLAHSLQNRKRIKTRLPFDPLLKMKHGSSDEHPSESLTVAKMQTGFGYNSTAYKGNGSWVGPFIMAMVMANCIRRSNAINKYSGANTLRYYEAASYSNVYHMLKTFIYSIIFGTCLYTPILDKLFYKYFLPQPGQGPSDDDMKSGYLRITAVGTGDQGTKVQTTLVLGYDPGYVGTAAMLMECADLLESDETNNQLLSGDEGGVYTPASCFGQPLMESLKAIGLEYQTEILSE